MGSDGLLEQSASIMTYGEVFEELFPLYLSYGMTYEQYWLQDCCLARYYRKSQDICNKRKNEELWMQGMYIHEAVSVAIQNAFGKEKIKYATEPYPLTKAEVEQREEKLEQARYEAMKARFESAITKLNVKGRADNESTNT